jgi:tRNA-splicing ligase RtcB
MDISRFEKTGEFCWTLAPEGSMRVPAVIYADESLISAMDEKVIEQLSNVATLPGIVRAAYAMPDAHWGYGFPIGGVAAFDPDAGGVVSAGGVGFDVSCGVRLLLTPLVRKDIEAHQDELADALFEAIPAGVGSHSAIALSGTEMDDMLKGGALWAVASGWGEERDLARIEEQGCMAGAMPEFVSDDAKRRQRKEIGTLGSGNHYLEVQYVSEIFDEGLAAGYGLSKRQAVISIHCGSRGLGHQIGTDFLRAMAVAAHTFGIMLPDRELACAPIKSELGQHYLGAMRSATNCALANREVLTSFTRTVFARFFPDASLELLYDVSHNTCKEETHEVNGVAKRLFVHRKGATRAFGPNHPDLPTDLRSFGQPVLIGGSMGTGSYVLAGLPASETAAFSSACHGAGRAMSRNEAGRRWKGRQVQDELRGQGVIVKSFSSRGIAEEAPGAYKDVSAVAVAAERAGLAKRVARLKPLVCVKG